MKEVWKKLLGGGVLVLLAAALVLTGCSSDDDDDDEIEWTGTRTYTGTDLSVTANADHTCAVTIGGKDYSATFTGNLEADTSGTITVTIDNEYVFDYTVDSTGNILTVDLTPANMTAVTLTRTDNAQETATGTLYTGTLSGLSESAPGKQVCAAAYFADLTTSSTVTLTVVCTTYSSSNTWYCYSVDGSTWTGDIKWSDSVGTSGGYTADITGDSITSLKTNGLYVYGSSDAVATLTVTAN